METSKTTFIKSLKKPVGCVYSVSSVPLPNFMALGDTFLKILNLEKTQTGLRVQKLGSGDKTVNKSLYLIHHGVNLPPP